MARKTGKRTTKRVFKEGKEIIVLRPSPKPEKPVAESKGPGTGAKRQAGRRPFAAKAARKGKGSEQRKRDKDKGGLAYDPFSKRMEGPAAIASDSYKDALQDIAARIGELGEALTLSEKEPEKKQKKGVQVDNYDLPHNYNKTKLRLMVKDPYWIFAYWEISPDTINALRARIGNELDGSRYVLRMYDVTCIDFNGKNANSWFDIDVGRDATSWYVSLWHDNVSYCGDIGIVTLAGVFHPFARSNFAHTPRIGQSGRRDLIWMEVKDENTGQPFISPRPKRERGRHGYSYVPSRKRIYLSHADVEAYYSRFFSAFGSGLFGRFAKRHSASLLKRYFSKDGAGDGFYIERLSDGRVRKIMLGSSEMMTEKESGLAGSEFVQRPKGKKDFYFSLDTELIVHGRTEPGAELYMGDRQVPLHDDGTFSLRFALSGGTIPLEFTACKRDRSDARRITTAVERKPTKKEGF